jgi:hypothetical protein
MPLSWSSSGNSQEQGQIGVNTRDIPKHIRLGVNRDIVDLGTSIVKWSIQSAAQINAAWGDLTGEIPMSQESNFIVRSEMLLFFLHMMDRFSFVVGGADVRATLQDAIVQNAIETLLTTSFQPGSDKEGFEQWISDMSSAGLEDFNNAGIDYSSCRAVGIEKPGSFFMEDSIIGKLAARIVQKTGRGNKGNLSLLIFPTVTQYFPELIELVKKASQVAK